MTCVSKVKVKIFRICLCGLYAYIFYILNTGCLLFVDDNIGFELLVRPWSETHFKVKTCHTTRYLIVSEDIFYVPPHRFRPDCRF